MTRRPGWRPSTSGSGSASGGPLTSTATSAPGRSSLALSMWPSWAPPTPLLMPLTGLREWPPLADLYSFQVRVPTTELVVGDLLYWVDAQKLTGPRGGRYRFDGVRVDSKVMALEPTSRGLNVVP